MERRYLLIIIMLAIIVRLASFGWVATHGGEAVLTSGDASTYVEVARNLAAGRGFVVEQNGAFVPEVFRAPGMPLLLAPFMSLPGGVFWWGAFLSVVAGLLLPLFAYLIGTRIFNHRAGLIAATLVAFEPHLVWFSWLLMSEMTATLLLLGAAVLATGAWEERWWPRVLLVGGLFGMLVLVRPPFFPILGALLLVSSAWFLWERKNRQFFQVLLIAVVLVAITVPWSLRNQAVTGQYALSGMGWYNVYFDYLSSLDAVKNGTSFAEEKIARMEHPPAGVSSEEILSPAATAIWRDEALAELSRRMSEVIKLEPAFLFSYFTHDGYFQYARQLNLLPTPDGSRGPSPTFVLLSQGVKGVPVVWEELQRQYFVPAVGRMFTIAVVLLALAGIWIRRRTPFVWLVAFAILLSAGVATIIGLGVEARSRVPVEPFLFVLAAGTLSALCSRYGEYCNTSSCRPRI